MDIVFFNRSFYPEITATGQLLSELCEDLHKDYHCKVTVIAARPRIQDNQTLPKKSFGRLIEKEDFKGVEVLRVKSTVFSHESFFGRVSNYLTYFFFSLVASFRIKKPDVVVTLTDPPIACLLGVCVALRFGAAFVISVRDIFPEVARPIGSLAWYVTQFFLDAINRFCFKMADSVVALGSLMRKRLIEEKGASTQKVSIISDWADSSKIFPREKRNNFSLTHGIADYFVVMYAGNLGVLSGAESILEAARLLQEHRDIVFVFIGEGIMKNQLITLRQQYGLENVRFFPYQPLDSLSDVFSSADVFIIPLKKGLAGYSVPSKVYPILASGRPFIASVEEVCEIAQIAKGYRCGILAKPQDAAEVAEKINFLYDNKSVRLEMGENARSTALLFDRKLGVKKYYELFQEVLIGKKSF